MCVCKGMFIIEVPLSCSGIEYLSTSTLFDLQPISWYKTNCPSMFFFHYLLFVVMTVSSSAQDRADKKSKFMPACVYLLFT